MHVVNVLGLCASRVLWTLERLIFECVRCRLQAKQLSCEACEKTFAVHSQYTAHMNTHVQCDEIGCSFSASGEFSRVFFFFLFSIMCAPGS